MIGRIIKQAKTIEWKLLIGFGVLLFLITAIGIIGIQQIYSFSARVSVLGNRYFPMQRAISEMKVSNSVYAVAIRNYIYWKLSRYLEAAKFSSRSQMADDAINSFSRNLNTYTRLARTSQERQWATHVTALHEDVASFGASIITLVDEATGSNQKAIDTRLQKNIDKMLMNFESKLYTIDNFLDTNLLQNNLSAIQHQLGYAEAARRQGLLLLWWALFFALFLGFEIAYFVYRDRRRERLRREKLVQRMIKFEEKERQNLSFQVHNQMGQDLGALKIFLGIIEKKAGKSKELDQSKSTLTKLIEKAHNISELLRPPALDEVSLEEIIEGLIFQYKPLIEAEFHYCRSPEAIKISQESSLTFYRVAQEALTNIVKYSQAKNVSISFEKNDESVKISVTDDGIGFDYNAFIRKPHRRKEDILQLGLLGLRERIELLGGQMKVESAPNRGTSIIVTLPV